MHLRTINKDTQNIFLDNYSTLMTWKGLKNKLLVCWIGVHFIITDFKLCFKEHNNIISEWFCICW